MATWRLLLLLLLLLLPPLLYSTVSCKVDRDGVARQGRNRHQPLQNLVEHLRKYTVGQFTLVYYSAPPQILLYKSPNEPEVRALARIRGATSACLLAPSHIYSLY